MKKTAILIVLFLVLTATLSSQAQVLPRLAVVEFSTNTNNERIRMDAITVRNLVESQMVETRKYQIITRNDIDKLLAEQSIMVSAISSSENILKLQLMNIRYVITGSLDAMGNDYAITLRVLDVSTGQFFHSSNDFMGSGSRELYTGITSLMTKFNEGMSAGTSGDIVPGGRIYKIGDFGPAGGLIFYDKGVFAGGWRYLEVAPGETEFKADWGAYNNDITGTGTAIGTGKRNTELIIEGLRRLGETGRAAQLCANLSYNGFN